MSASTLLVESSPRHCYNFAARSFFESWQSLKAAKKHVVIITARTVSVQAYLVQQSIGWGFGSLLFHIGGWIALARQSHLRYFPRAA